MKKQYYIYIATNKRNTVLYTGVTNDLNRRMYEHRQKLIKGFTSEYNIIKLIYFQEFDTPEEAILAEKRIKGWRREKKVALIKSINPYFKNLIEE